MDGLINLCNCLTIEGANDKTLAKKFINNIVAKRILQEEGIYHINIFYRSILKKKNYRIRTM